MRMPVASLKSNPLVMLVDEISRMRGRVSSLFADIHSATGLKPMESLVLNAIEESEYPPSVSQIGRSIGQPRQVIQRSVNELESNGYISKLPNPSHKNVPLLTLTPKGRQSKEQSNSHALAVAEAFLKRIDREQCRELALQLQEIRREMEAFSRDNKDAEKR